MKRNHNATILVVSAVVAAVGVVALVATLWIFRAADAAKEEREAAELKAAVEKVQRDFKLEPWQPPQREKRNR